MQANEGTIDRIIRAILAVAALAGAVALGFGSVGGVLLLVVGAVLAVTAAVGFCPLYRVLGVSTCPVARR
jgi:hypothetical protein